MEVGEQHHAGVATAFVAPCLIETKKRDFLLAEAYLAPEQLVVAFLGLRTRHRGRLVMQETLETLVLASVEQDSWRHE